MPRKHPGPRPSTSTSLRPERAGGRGRSGQRAQGYGARPAYQGPARRPRCRTDLGQGRPRVPDRKSIGMPVTARWSARVTDGFSGGMQREAGERKTSHACQTVLLPAPVDVILPPKDLPPASRGRSGSSRAPSAVCRPPRWRGAMPGLSGPPGSILHEGKNWYRSVAIRLSVKPSASPVIKAVGSYQHPQPWGPWT